MLPVALQTVYFSNFIDLDLSTVHFVRFYYT